MQQIWERIAKLQVRSQPAALATIIATRGSTPRNVGTKMLVLSDGSIVGTMDGGCVEAEIWQAAIFRLRYAPMFQYALTPWQRRTSAGREDSCLYANAGFSGSPKAGEVRCCWSHSAPLLRCLPSFPDPFPVDHRRAGLVGVAVNEAINQDGQECPGQAGGQSHRSSHCPTYPSYREKGPQ